MNNIAIQLLPPPECEVPYSISQINQGISDRIESGNTVVWFSGEISNFKKQYGSGHCYLRLKDAESQIAAVIWNSNAARLGFEPDEGMEVTGIASIRVYKKGGNYQLDIHRMQPSGLGALYAAYEALKKKLDAEGLFAESRKRPLPIAVNAIGVVTSKSGAAIRDIVRVVHSRAPQTSIVLRSVAVQGKGSAEQIAAAIADLNAYGKVDILIVGRGGGSIEDLWAFNEEVVARAIASSAIAVISAVGHETDFTIADFVADARAATPSAAAEMAVADVREQERHFRTLAEHLLRGYGAYFQDLRDHFDNLTGRSCFRLPLTLLNEARQSFDEASVQLYSRAGSYVRGIVSRLRASAGRLHALSPLAVLGRGYAVVSRPGGDVVRDAAQLGLLERVNIRFQRGSATAEITAIDQ